MAYVYAFIAGFLSTLAFHQGALGLLHLAGLSPRAPFAMNPVPPLGVPAVVSLAFWGGVWGVALWPLLRRLDGGAFWACAIAVGAVAPSLIALLVVFPLKGLPVERKVVVGALIVNGAWGLGLAAILRLLARLPH
jgi:hypothetical protein